MSKCSLDSINQDVAYKIIYIEDLLFEVLELWMRFESSYSAGPSWTVQPYLKMTLIARLYQVDVLLIDLNTGVLKQKSKNKVQEWKYSLTKRPFLK